MADREKVLKGLAFHLKELTIGKTCFDCPYWGDNPCEIQLIANALELLKEQEAVEPMIKTSHDGKGSWWYICGSCNTAVDPKDKYCRECGRRLKWE